MTGFCKLPLHPNSHLPCKEPAACRCRDIIYRTDHKNPALRSLLHSSQRETYCFPCSPPAKDTADSVLCIFHPAVLLSTPYVLPPLQIKVHKSPPNNSFLQITGSLPLYIAMNLRYNSPYSDFPDIRFHIDNSL